MPVIPFNFSRHTMIFSHVADFYIYILIYNITTTAVLFQLPEQQNSFTNQI